MFFPLSATVQYDDMCLYALGQHMKQHGIDPMKIDGSSSLLNHKKSDLHWIVNSDPEQYPFGIFVRPNEQLRQEVREKLQGIVNEYLNNFEVLVKRIQEDSLHFMQECIQRLTEDNYLEQADVWFSFNFDVHREYYYKRAFLTYVNHMMLEHFGTDVPAEEAQLNLFHTYLYIWEYQLPSAIRSTNYGNPIIYYHVSTLVESKTKMRSECSEGHKMYGYDPEIGDMVCMACKTPLLSIAMESRR